MEKNFPGLQCVLSLNIPKISVTLSSMINKTQMDKINISKYRNYKCTDWSKLFL